MEKGTSRRKENNGDGMYLGLKAGCKLIDMEMVQFHPTGMLFPKDYEGTLVTEAVGERGRLLTVMQNYDRMELSIRDRITIANYLEVRKAETLQMVEFFLI